MWIQNPALQCLYQSPACTSATKPISSSYNTEQAPAWSSILRLIIPIISNTSRHGSSQLRLSTLFDNAQWGSAWSSAMGLILHLRSEWTGRRVELCCKARLIERRGHSLLTFSSSCAGFLLLAICYAGEYDWKLCTNLQVKRFIQKISCFIKTLQTVSKTTVWTKWRAVFNLHTNYNI